jgi:hypothetical protein
MGSVKVSFHPPLLLAPPGVAPPAAELCRCRHAALWLSVIIEPWQVERSGHLHLLQVAGESSWREVDLTRHPLRALAEEPEPPDAEGVVADLRQALAGRNLSFFRIPEIGLVSEIGEAREYFRRRATGGLRPQLKRRLAAEQGAAARERMASELASLSSSIETLELGDFGRWVRRAELGALLVAPGVRLEAPRYRPLMV